MRVATVLILMALVTACASSAPAPQPPPVTTSEEPEELDPPFAPSLRSRVDAITRLCRDALDGEGDCLAPRAETCDEMQKVGLACFEISGPEVKCLEVQAQVIRALALRKMGATVQNRVASFCEAACEVRQKGLAWELVLAALKQTCE